MLWAFARENGVPCSKHIAKVSSLSHERLKEANYEHQIDTRTRLPSWAIAVTVVISLLLALINIGSSEAFLAFISLLVAAYFSSFLLAAGVMLYRRLTMPDSSFIWGPFRLGRAGVPITIVAMLYTVFGIFFSFWPPNITVTAANLNYSPVIFGSALIFSLGFWVLHGRKVYTGPVMEPGTSTSI